MRSDWIIDVLADLRRFAEANDLPLLAEQLDDTALVATAEIACKGREACKARTCWGTNETGAHPVRLGTGGTLEGMQSVSEALRHITRGSSGLSLGGFEWGSIRLRHLL